jgi:hypothetical protein
MGAQRHAAAALFPQPDASAAGLAERRRRWPPQKAIQKLRAFFWRMLCLSRQPSQRKFVSTLGVLPGFAQSSYEFWFADQYMF